MAEALAEVAAPPHVGKLVRGWRARRRLSQLQLALDAGVSARLLSLIETGRSRPSREMVVQLAAQLDVPLRERNDLLLAAGYAPLYGQRGLEEPEMGPVREPLDHVLSSHEPYPPMVVDRHWDIIAANKAVFTAHRRELLLSCLSHRPTSCRLALHPDGVAPRIVNLAQLPGVLLQWLSREAAATGDPALEALWQELSELPGAGAPPQCRERSRSRFGSAGATLSFRSSARSRRSGSQRHHCRRAVDRVPLSDGPRARRGPTRVRRRTLP